jgi:chlorite dismutase
VSHAPSHLEISPALDLREKGGVKNDEPQLLDKRLFIQLQAFTGNASIQALAQALENAGIAGVIYEDIHDPKGIALVTMSEKPEDFLLKIRPCMIQSPWAELSLKPEYSLLGRTYALGYEPELEDWLLHRPKRVIFDPQLPWAVWYPLRRTGEFSKLPRQEQGQILKEHGQIGRLFGDSGFAQDIRLSCAGMDKSDNDFVIGLIGKELHPLSALVERMRATQQTSTYIQNMGPFFVGRVAWRSK